MAGRAQSTFVLAALLLAAAVSFLRTTRAQQSSSNDPMLVCNATSVDSPARWEGKLVLSQASPASLTYTFHLEHTTLANATSASFNGPTFSQQGGGEPEGPLLHTIYNGLGTSQQTELSGRWSPVTSKEQDYLLVNLVYVNITLEDDGYLTGICQLSSTGQTGYDSSSFNEKLCSDNTSGLSPFTWCHYQNPYIQSLPVSNVNYSRTDCFFPHCEVSENEGIQARCLYNGQEDHEDPLSVCVGVTRFTSLETYSDYYTYGLENGQPGGKEVDVSNRTVYNYPFVFTVVGLESGKVVANVVNNLAPQLSDTLFASGQTSFMSRQVHAESVSWLLSLGFVEYSPLDTQGLIVSSDGLTTNVMLLNTTVWPPANITSCLTVSHQNAQVISINLWQSSYLWTDAIMAILTKTAVDYQIIFYTFHFNTTGSASASQSATQCPPHSTRRWIIPPTASSRFDSEPLLGMSVRRHYFNVSNAFFFKEITQPRLTTVRTIALLYTTQQCHLFQVEGESQPVISSSISVWDSSAYSLFYGVSLGGIIQSADLFGEFILRARNTSSTIPPSYIAGSTSRTHDQDLQPSQLLWLTVGWKSFQEVEEYQLQFVCLNDFAYFQNSPARTEIDNPVGIQPAQQQTCGVLSWFDSTASACQPRKSYYHPLPRATKHIQSRFRSLDTSKAGQQGGVSSPDELRKVYSQFLYTVVYVQYVADDKSLFDTMTLLGCQPVIGDKEAMNVNVLNDLSYLGSVISIYASTNSFHMILTVKRHLFNIQAIKRLNEICQDISDPIRANRFLAFKYSRLCNTPDYISYLSRKTVSINDFTWYSSSCVAASYCPSMINASISRVPDGLYTLRSFEAHECEKGYFCPGGGRYTCPPGYKCPRARMVTPERCQTTSTFNTTCYSLTVDGAPGLAEELPCPAGFLCPVPYLAPVPAPPGYMMDNRPSSPTEPYMTKCPPGTWCSLAEYAYNTSSGNLTDLSCQSGFYCPQPSVLAPTQCTFSRSGGFFYCPAGTHQQKLCPSGSYCTSPLKVTECTPHQYCPAGQFSESPCPSPYYCPNASVKIICPDGHYCKPGTVNPRRCPILTSCPEGTPSQKNSGLAVVAVFFPIIVLVVASVLCLRYRNKKRDRRHNTRAAYAAMSSVDDEDGAKVKSDLRESLLSTGYRFHAGSDTGSTETLDEQDAPVVADQPGDQFTIDFRFEELGLKLKSSGKQVLQGVTGCIKSYQVTAVMGPSGAGKSTFITTLCGKATYGQRTGKVFINECIDDLTRYRKVVGFVPQDDIMLRMMTVKEILTFHARMRLRADMPEQEKRQKVNRVIEELGLYEIRHSIIGDETNRGISGGQRKRVNIGMEMVADPVVLFLDEPTSGLDSTSSKEVCACLKRIAESGLTIVTVIHQPRYEIFKMFHSVLLLGKGGRTVYLGPSEQSLPYFQSIGFQCPEHANPPDFFMDVISGDVRRPGHPEFQPSDLFELWENASAAQANEGEAEATGRPTTVVAFDFKENSRTNTILGDELSTAGRAAVKARRRNTANIVIQLYQFTLRALVQMSRDWQGLVFDFFLVLISGLFLGMIYFQVFYIGPLPKAIVDQCPKEMLNASPSPCRVPRNDPLPGQSCVASLALALAAVSGALRIFGTERNNFWRESSAGVSTLAYYLGKSLAHMPTIVLAPFMFLILYYQLVTPLASVGGYFLICFLVYWTASGYGYLVSIIVPPSMAQLFAVLSVLFNMMFSGAIPTFTQLQKVLGGVLMYPTYISYIRWSQEAFYLHEIEQYRNIYHDVQSGMDIYQYKFSQYTLDVAMIFVVGVLVRIAAYVALELMYRSKRK